MGTTQFVGMRIVAAGLASWVLAIGALGCATTQNAAARDPMKCERDPSCSRGRSSYADCTKECVDNPQCVELCSEIQRTSDSLGH
jgi:hypothetical protein